MTACLSCTLCAYALILIWSIDKTIGYKRALNSSCCNWVKKTEKCKTFPTGKFTIYSKRPCHLSHIPGNTYWHLYHDSKYIQRTEARSHHSHVIIAITASLPQINVLMRVICLDGQTITCMQLAGAGSILLCKCIDTNSLVATSPPSPYQANQRGKHLLVCDFLSSQEGWWLHSWLA